MTTDWRDRTAALDYFSKLLKQAKRFNEDEKDLYEAAVNALRRSQDHTAIGNKLNETIKHLAHAEAAQRQNAETIAEQQREIKRLKRWIKENAEHSFACSAERFNQPLCTCGLDEEQTK